MGRAERNKRDKLDRILRAARELFARRGYAGTTMDDIAQHAQVSKGALYFHVGSKAELLNRVFHSDFTAWIDQAFDHGHVPPDTDLIDRLVLVYSRLLRLMCDAPDLTRVYMTAAGVDDDRARLAMVHLLGLTADLVDKAKSDGEIDADVDSRQLAYNLWALYFVEQHRWLLEHPTPEGADPTDLIQARLRRPFTTQLRGYLTSPGPDRPGARPPMAAKDDAR
ncbi:MAG: TetR/AcrR family transcriptional regulator [Acidimicrobiales bacterium]